MLFEYGNKKKKMTQYLYICVEGGGGLTLGSLVPFLHKIRSISIFTELQEWVIFKNDCFSDSVKEIQTKLQVKQYK